MVTWSEEGTHHTHTRPCIHPARTYPRQRRQRPRKYRRQESQHGASQSINLPCNPCKHQQTVRPEQRSRPAAVPAPGRPIPATGIANTVKYLKFLQVQYIGNQHFTQIYVAKEARQKEPQGLTHPYLVFKSPP